jgi:hypothetical protein
LFLSLQSLKPAFREANVLPFRTSSARRLTPLLPVLHGIGSQRIGIESMFTCIAKRGMSVSPKWEIREGAPTAEVIETNGKERNLNPILNLRNRLFNPPEGDFIPSEH